MGQIQTLENFLKFPYVKKIRRKKFAFNDTSTYAERVHPRQRLHAKYVLKAV